VFCLYFSKTACKLGQFLSSEEWLSQIFFILVVFIVGQAVDTFVFLWGCCTFLKLVASCAERAGFLSSAIAKPVIKSGAFKTPISNYVVPNFAD